MVDPRRPALQPVRDRLGPVQVGAPDGAAEPEARAVGRVDGLVETPVRQHRQHRPELFLRHHRTGRRDIGEDRRSEEIARPVQPVAAGRGPGAVRQRPFGDLLHACQLRGVVDGAQPGARVKAAADGDGLRPPGERLDHLRVQPGGGVHAFDRHADLPAVAERGPEQPVRGPLHIDVVQQDRRVVAAQLQGDPGEGGRRPLGDRPPGGHRTGEGDMPDARMGGQPRTERFASGDDGQHVLGQGGGEDGSQQPGGERGEGGRFEDHGIARRERGRELRRRQLQREVPRDDRGDGPQRTPADLAAHGPAVADPPCPGRQLREVPQPGRCAGDLRVRLGQWFALLPGEQPGEVVARRFHGVGRAEQRVGPGGGLGPPAGPGPVGPADHRVQFVRACVGGLAEGLPGGRVDDGEPGGPAGRVSPGHRVEGRHPAVSPRR